MIDGGCRKIAHIALPRRYLWAQKREKGYLQALKDRHLFTDEKLIVECEDVSEVYRISPAIGVAFRSRWYFCR